MFPGLSGNMPLLRRREIMVNVRAMFVKRFVSYVLLSFVSAVVFSLLPACQTTNPDATQAITNLSNELEETNQKLEEIYHRVSVVQFMVDNHERTITDLEKTLKKSGVIQGSTYSPVIRPAATKKDPGHPPSGGTAKSLLTPEPDSTAIVAATEDSLLDKSPEHIYNKAFAALKRKNYTRAISMFKTVVSDYPEHNLADNAIYWTGEVHYTQNDFPEAIRTFKRLIESYPEGGKVPDALLKIGYSYYSMKDNENAVKYLKKVVVDYPFTVPGSKAESMLNKIE